MEQKEIEKLIGDLYPGEKIIKLLEGGMSYAYEIDNKIIRIPKNKLSEAGYIREDAILKCLHRTIDCTKLPEIKIVQKPFFHTVHNKINGFYWDSKTYLSKSEKEKDALAEDCAVFFAQLHGTNLSEINAELPEIPSIQEDLESYLLDFFTTEEIDKILKFTEPLYFLGDKVLVHKDFYYDNFLLNDEYRLNAVFDFGNSGIYNYMYDFKCLVGPEEGMHDLFVRLTPRYIVHSGRQIDIETVHRVDIHNYINFLSYFVKNKNIKDEKIGAMNNLSMHIGYIKEKIKKL